MSKNDVIIIGAGQNSLVAAFYLARAGLKPLVLERRSEVGGLSSTIEFHPGFRASLLDGAAGPLAPAILRDTELERGDIQWLDGTANLCTISCTTRALLLSADTGQSANRIAVVSKKDVTKYAELDSVLAQARPFLQKLLTTAPPEIEKPSTKDFLGFLQMGRGFRKLGRKNMQRLLRWGPMAVADFAAEFFEAESLRAAISTAGIFGAAAGPWSAGTAVGALLRFGAARLPSGRGRGARGGEGAISAALASSAKKAGAEIRTNAEVAQVRVKNGAATGVVLVNGEEISARAVVSGADPKRTFLKLVDPIHLAPSFAMKVRNYRMQGTVARLFFALDAAPEFAGLKELPESDRREALAGRIVIAPEVDYIERTFDASKYGEIFGAPYLEVTIPSLTDDSLAPAGKHVMAVHMQYVPYKLKNGDWQTRRDELADIVVKTIAQYAPNFPSHILARHVITPVDFENDYAATGGHIFHGELALDQLFVARPMLGFARYATPIRGLFLCGRGTHPGIGFAGVSGFNAAGQVVKSIHSSPRHLG